MLADVLKRLAVEETDKAVVACSGKQMFGVRSPPGPMVEQRRRSPGRTSPLASRVRRSRWCWIVDCGLWPR